MKILSMIVLLLVMSVFAQSKYEKFLHFIESYELMESNVADTFYHEEQSWEDLRYSMYYDADSDWIFLPVHFIAGPVDINCSTGEVVIAEGANLSSASIKFWRSLEAAYPYLFGKRRE